VAFCLFWGHRFQNRALRRHHLIGGGAPEVYGRRRRRADRKVGVGDAKMKSAAAAAFGGAYGLVLIQNANQLLDLLISLLIYESMQAELRKPF